MEVKKLKLGIDIGGTHTDGVLLNQNNKVIRTIKLPTEHQDLTTTILTSCQKLTSELKSETINRIILSTTLATNTITEKKYQPGGLILIPGPGLNPTWYSYSPHTTIISGSIDHRGRKVQKINLKEVKKAVANFTKQGIKKISICGKFAPRNPEQELEIKNLIQKHFPEIKQINLSHQISGQLNYPRRVATTYLNNLVQETQAKFINQIQTGLEKLNLKAPTYILKADGGTMPLTKSRHAPVKTINSGPAASIMGIMALSELSKTTVGIDIGGTTTDISLFVNKEPLFKPTGIEIDNYKTAVRGLYNKSIGCGGDSLIQLTNNKLKIGPQRKGAAAALGGPGPTPTDALVVLNLMEKGDRQAAKKSLQPIASQLELSVQKLADKIIDQFCQKIKSQLQEILTKLNNQPVYTINELLSDTTIQPTKLVGIGGPAQALIPELANILNLDYTIPDNSAITNAIGAALTRVTKKCTLYADTAQGYYNIPELGIKNEITGDFNSNTAQQIVKQELKSNLANQPTNIEITHNESFNLVRGFNTIGQIIEITAQVKPGLIIS